MKTIFSLFYLTVAVILFSLPEIRGQSNLQYVVNSSGSVLKTLNNQYIEYSVGEVYATDGNFNNYTVAGICQPNYILISIPSVFDEHFKIQVFPNPVQSVLSIETDYSYFKKTRIVNEIGQVLLETNFEKTINISELPVGTFLIQFVTDETQYLKTIKIIKQ